MFVYCATNRKNGKRYVGITTRSHLSTRISEHQSKSRTQKSRFAYAIRKHGFDAFAWEILERCEFVEQLREAEKTWIEKFNTMRHGYNSNSGGVGSFFCSDETRAKLSAATKGRKLSAEICRERSIRLKGQKPSAACIDAVRAANKKRTPEQVEKRKAAIRAAYAKKRKV